MIISASRRTDIPAFYTEWLMNRLRAGYCTTPNPFNPRQVSTIPLRPQDVDIIVFWTRDAQPILKDLSEFDKRGYRYYFLYTILNNPSPLDPWSPSLSQAIDTFQKLSEYIGPGRVIWRYDPIILSNRTDTDFHLESFSTIASALRGATRRVVISLLDLYASIKPRLRSLEKDGIVLNNSYSEDIPEMMNGLAEIAHENDMEIQTCAENHNLEPYGIKPGKCIDDQLIYRVFGIRVSGEKDPGQRKHCGCIQSRDIGMYSTCPRNCVYCYARSSEAAVTHNRSAHNPESPSLIGWHEPQNGKPGNDEEKQPRLFSTKLTK